MVVTIVVVVLVTIAAVAGIAISRRGEYRRNTRLGRLPAEERGARLEADYQAELEREGRRPPEVE